MDAGNDRLPPDLTGVPISLSSGQEGKMHPPLPLDCTDPLLCTAPVAHLGPVAAIQIVPFISGVVLGYPGFPRPCSTEPSQAAVQAASVPPALLAVRNSHSTAGAGHAALPYNFGPSRSLALKVSLLPLSSPCRRQSPSFFALSRATAGSVPLSHCPLITSFILQLPSVIYLYPTSSAPPPGQLGDLCLSVWLFPLIPC